MKALIGGRRSGKTTQLLRQADEEGSYVVGGHNNSLEKYREKATLLHLLNIKGFIPYMEFIRRSTHPVGYENATYCIDDVECLLQYLNPNVTAITVDTSHFITGDPIENIEGKFTYLYESTGDYEDREYESSGD